MSRFGTLCTYLELADRMQQYFASSFAYFFAEEAPDLDRLNIIADVCRDLYRFSRIWRYICRDLAVFKTIRRNAKRLNSVFKDSERHMSRIGYITQEYAKLAPLGEYPGRSQKDSTRRDKTSPRLAIFRTIHGKIRRD